MRKYLLTIAAAALCSAAFAAEGDQTTILDQTFNGETTLADTDAYTWGSDIQGMITETGLYVTNKSNKSNNYENLDFITFANPVGNATNDVNISYEVYSPKDKGQDNTYYAINYFNADGEFVFGIQEASGGWAYTANIVTANADGTQNTIGLPAGHMKKAGGSTVELTVKFAGDNALVSIDGGTYAAYTKSEGIKAVKLSVTGENGYDRDMYVKNYVVKTTEVAAAQVADYTLKYVVDSETIKEEVKSGIVGSEISLAANEIANFYNEDKTVKYIYVSNDAEGKTINADGKTVVTIVYRLAAEFNYTVTNNVNDAKATGKCLEGESVTVPFSRYILANDKVVWMKDAINKEYNYTFTPDADNFEVVLSYSETDMKDGIYFCEAENHEGMTEVTGSNANVRCSNAAGGYADSAIEVCTLTPGTYKVRIGVWGKGGTRFLVNAGTENVLYTETTGSWFEEIGDEFTLTAETVITFEGATSTTPVDYFLITGDGSATSAVAGVEAANADGKWYNLQGVQIAAPTQPGLYIKNGKKVIVK